MRHAPALSLLASLVLVAGCASSPGPADAGPGVVANPVECLDPSWVRGWDYVDDDELLVDAGRRKYRIRLAERCFALGTAPALVFDGDAVNNRVCGHAGETIIVGRDRCRIQSVERLDDATYESLRDPNQARGEVRAGTRAD